MILSDLTGSWVGTNQFRLMPGDPLTEFPATVTVTTAAGGHLTLVAYTWQHPTDGPQDGLVVIWSTGSGDALSAVWSDSWHQKPEPMVFSGGLDNGSAAVLAGDYGGGWGWRISLDSGDGGQLRLLMENVIPAEQATPEVAAGPYPVMVTDVRRA